MVSNTSLGRNADDPLSKREKEVPVDWFHKTKIPAPSEKYKTSY